MEESAYGEKSGGAPLPVARRPPIRPIGFRSVSAVTVFVIAMSVVQAFSFAFAVWYFNDLRRLGRVVDLQSWEARVFDSSGDRIVAGEESHGVEVSDGDVSRRERGARLAAELMLMVPAFLLLHVFELVAFVLWQMRTHENLSALGSYGLRFGSRSAVVWWFVPVAVLWKPVLVVQEIWRASDPGVAAGDEMGWGLRPGSVRVMLWWALLVGAKCLYWGSLFMALVGLVSIASPLELWIIALALTCLASFLQIDVVRAIAQRQGALERKRSSAVRKAEAAGEPVVDADAMLIRVIKERSRRHPRRPSLKCWS